MHRKVSRLPNVLFMLVSNDSAIFTAALVSIPFNIDREKFRLVFFITVRSVIPRHTA